MARQAAWAAVACALPVAFAPDAWPPADLAIQRIPARLVSEYKDPGSQLQRRGRDRTVQMAAGAQVNQLLGKWAQSFEEDADGGLVFRPFSFSFPPSRRGRTMLNFKPDGALEVGLGPGPDDRTQTGAGRWELLGDRLTIDAPGWSGTFEIETLDQNRLVLRRRP